jgi:MinD-like ATPase involved in chromosome partitioning or flagellar assembly
MAEIALPVIITAISNSEQESFVAGTLFTQGWSVIHRAVDFESLHEFASSNPEQASSALLLYSPDLNDFDSDSFETLSLNFRQIIGFASSNSPRSVDDGLHEIPSTAPQLATFIRGYVRSPLIRKLTPLIQSNNRARVIAISSAGSCTGASTMAINLAYELSLKEKRVLLIDANLSEPNIAIYLDQRNLIDEELWRLSSPCMYIKELTRERIAEFDSVIERAHSDFDFIIIDIGTIHDLSSQLSDRRADSLVITWAGDHADELWIIARPDRIGQMRFKKITSILNRTSIISSITFVLNMRTHGRKGQEEEKVFLSVATTHKAAHLYVLPSDIRSTTDASESRAALAEVNERGVLRKALASIASEMIS